MSSVPPPQTNSTQPVPASAPVRASPGRPDEPPWPVWTAPAAVLVGLVVGVLGSVFVAGIGRRRSARTRPHPAVTLVSDVVFDLGFVATALYFASAHGRRPRPSDFGYRRIALSARRSRRSALAGAGYYVVTAIYPALVKLHGTDKLPKRPGRRARARRRWSGRRYSSACSRRSPRNSSSAASSSARCAGAHSRSPGTRSGPGWRRSRPGSCSASPTPGSASTQYLIPLGFLGFVLCIVRWKTRSLYPCMALHSVNNSIALGYNELHWNGGEIVAPHRGLGRRDRRRDAAAREPDSSPARAS